MSRILKVMIVLLAIAAMVTPVMAEDRLSLNGSMRVRAFYVDNGDDYTESFVDQRLRIGGKLSIAEGVSVTFRFDETEANWGTPNSDGTNRQGVRFIEGETGMQWDRAHLDLDFGSFKLRAGQAYFGAGLTAALDTQDAGIQVVAGPVKAFFVLDSNNDTFIDRDGNGKDDYNGTDSSDDYLVGLTYAQKMDNVKFEILSGLQKADDEEVYLVGANVVAGLEALTLSAELDYFTGDASATKDAMGTQLYVDAAFAATETVTVGGKVLYALAADSDEVQYSYLGNSFGDWKPLTAILGGMAGEKGSSYTHPHSKIFKNAGLIGLNGYAKVKASDDLSLAGSASYLMPEDDDMSPTSDDAFQVVLASTYKLMSNAYLDATAQYTDKDGSEEEYVAGMGLFVKF